MDVISGCQITGGEFRVQLHDDHWMAGSRTNEYSTAESFLISLFNRSAQYVKYPSLTKCPVCEYQRGNYSNSISIRLILNQLILEHKSKFQKMYQDFQAQVTRYQTMKENNSYDCLVCTEHVGQLGIAEKLPIDMQEVYGDLYRSLRRCNTCESTWCYLCEVPLDEHEGMSCIDVQKELLRNNPSLYETKKNSVKCPGCFANVMKTSGCNHMTCKCGAEFCYLCLKPYNSVETRHFDQCGPCYNKKFWKYTSGELMRFRKAYADPILANLWLGDVEKPKTLPTTANATTITNTSTKPSITNTSITNTSTKPSNHCAIWIIGGIGLLAAWMLNN